MSSARSQTLWYPYQGALYFLPRLKMTDMDIPLVPWIALKTGNWFLQINTYSSSNFNNFIFLK
jgi:hypothetical protein